MKKGIIYVRVSSNEQVQGTSLDNQERACLEYAEKNNIEVVKIYIEKGESATAANRTEFLKALEYCRIHSKEVESFIVWKIDRFARNTTDHFAVRAKLTQYGVTLQSVTEPITNDPSGKLMETLLAGYAEFENDIRKQRCIGGMQGRLREGIWCWSPPIGYTNSMKMKDRKKTLPDVPDEERFYLIQKGLKLYKAGNHTITALAQESSKWGLKTRTGRPMRKQLWDTILTNKFYAGILVDPWSLEEQQGQHKPMITLEDFNHIQMIKKNLSNNATASRLSTNPDFPLRRFVLCECHHLYTASWSTGRSKKYASYHCHGKQCVHFGHTVAKDTLEDEFYKLLQKVAPQTKFLKLFERIVIETYKNQHTLVKQEKDHYERNLSKLEARKKELMEMRISREISKEDYKDLKDALDNQITSLHISRNEAQIEEFDMEIAIAHTTKLIGDVANQWKLMSPIQKQKLQKLVLPQGITYQKSTGTFGTAILSPVFKLNETFTAMPSELVAGVGIEPTIFRL